MKPIPAAAWACAALLLVSCRRPENGPAAAPEPVKTFTVQGLLRSIDFAGSSIQVTHEDIPGFMPAMTMPFDVKTMAEVEPLRAGDAIQFQMIVTEDASWIEGVKRIDAREIQLPEAKQPAGEAAVTGRLKEGDEMPDFRLVDSKGRSVTRATFAGRPVLLTFIFTRCPIPNFCPLMMKNFQEIRQSLTGAPAQAASVQLLSITIDPEFDTPQVLAQYAAGHTPDTDQWRFATGTEAEIKQLTQAFSVAVQPSDGTLNHGLATVLLGADGAIRRVWRGNGWETAEVLEALHAL